MRARDSDRQRMGLSHSGRFCHSIGELEADSVGASVAGAHIDIASIYYENYLRGKESGGEGDAGDYKASLHTLAQQMAAMLPAADREIRAQLASDAERFLIASDEIRELFDSLLNEWKQDTFMLSDATAIITHPAHLRIIGLGPQVLPLILADLERGGGPWFVALTALSRTNPVEPTHESDAKLIREDWLAWGRRNAYL